jgi:hypothetical protein
VVPDPGHALQSRFQLAGLGHVPPAAADGFLDGLGDMAGLLVQVSGQPTVLVGYFPAQFGNVSGVLRGMTTGDFFESADDLFT